jgi:hypothetical protein
MSTNRPTAPITGAALVSVTFSLSAVDDHVDASFGNVDLEVDPLVLADVGGRFVSAVRVLRS